VVLLKNFVRGELAPPGVPVVTLGDPERLWLRCYVAAPMLPRIKRAAPVEVTIDGTRQTFRGHVAEIATRAEFTPRAALTEDERANLVFGVKVALDATRGTLKAGLPAEARISRRGDERRGPRSPAAPPPGGHPPGATPGGANPAGAEPGPPDTRSRCAVCRGASAPWWR